jgi:hypothetical protein
MDSSSISYDNLLTLWDQMTILPDSVSLRMINYMYGTHAQAKAKDIGLGLGDEIDMVLTEPMTTEQMYKHLHRIWLAALNEP